MRFAPYRYEVGLITKKIYKNIRIILFIITMVFLIQIAYNNIEPKYRLIINTVTVYISNHKKKVRGQIISATQYAANKRLGFKLCPLYGDIFVYGVYMDVGKLYFVNDSFYERFKQ